MIITRTPLRVSFVGGGTDLPAFYRREPGAVVSTTIDKYSYIAAHPYFTDEIQLKYSETERVSSVNDIKMPVFREALKLYSIERKIDLYSIADLPREGGSGLGGSTAFSVGLLNCLGHHTGKIKTQVQLAEEATHLDIEILKNPIGKQDQYASAVGGLNFIQFNPDETVVVEPIYLSPDVRRTLNDRLLMFYTGVTRDANRILRQQQDNSSEDEKYKAHQEMRDYAIRLRNELRDNNIENFGAMLHENWVLKRELTEGISNSQIDEWYKKALEAKAEGGKILGAGGGGFLLFYCKEEHQERLRQSLADLVEFKFAFEPEGTKLVLNDQCGEK